MSSSDEDEDFQNDTTLNNNSTNSEDSSEGNEIIPPSTKFMEIKKIQLIKVKDHPKGIKISTMPTMWYMEHMRHWIPLRHQTFNPFQLDQ